MRWCVKIGDKVSRDRLDCGQRGSNLEALQKVIDKSYTVSTKYEYTLWTGRSTDVTS